MKNALTIDVEDWYQTLDFNFPQHTWGIYEDRVTENLKKIISVLDRFNIKATFFVLGCIAEKHPALIKELVLKGHEIGSHGTDHRLVYKQTPKEFRKDIVNSKNILEHLTGKKVELFRASSWSISKDTLWALEILEEEGFVCDSSMQPFKTPLSGVSGAPKIPFHPSINNRELSLVEFPPTVLPVGKGSIPFSGGLYLRTLPIAFVKHALKKVNEEREGMIYTHPWEYDVSQPKLKVSPVVKFTHYYNLKRNYIKLEELLKTFSFEPLGKIIKNKAYPVINLAFEKNMENNASEIKTIFSRR